MTSSFAASRSVRAVLSACALVAAQGAFAAGPTVTIGQAIDLSGPDAAIGRDYVAGIKTYLDAVNASGGVNGKRVQFVVRDDLGQADGAVKAITELIERDQVDYVFGGVGDTTTQAILNAPAFQRSGHILFAPLANAQQATNRPVMYWRPSYTTELRHIFAHFRKLGINDVGVVVQESEANQRTYLSLASEMREQGMRTTGTARIGIDGKVPASDVIKLANTKPGVVIVIADTIGTSLFLKEFRQHDAKTFVAGTSLINLSTLRELAGAKAVEWTVFSQVVPNPNAGASPIQMEHLNMMKKYRDEAVSSLTLEGFAAAKSLVKAIQQSKKGGRAALHELVAQQANIELGGLSIVATPKSNHLSNYIDIALFRKGSGLVF